MQRTLLCFVSLLVAERAVGHRAYSDTPLEPEDAPEDYEDFVERKLDAVPEALWQPAGFACSAPGESLLLRHQENASCCSYTKNAKRQTAYRSKRGAIRRGEKRRYALYTYWSTYTRTTTTSAGPPGTPGPPGPSSSSRPGDTTVTTTTSGVCTIPFPSGCPEFKIGHPTRCGVNDVLLRRFYDGIVDEQCCEATRLSCSGCGDYDKANDTCKKCEEGYILTSDGHCDVCQDMPEWTDGSDRGCEFYGGKDGFCAHGAVTEKTIAESKTKTAVAQFLNESESWVRNGLSALAACCVCGGGLPGLAPFVYPVLSLPSGSPVRIAPLPRVASIYSSKNCNLHGLGLSINYSSGIISGELIDDPRDIDCEILAHSRHGLEIKAPLKLSFADFTYGMPTLTFKPGYNYTVQTRKEHSFRDFDMKCTPELPWLKINFFTGELIADSNPSNATGPVLLPRYGRCTITAARRVCASDRFVMDGDKLDTCDHSKAPELCEEKCWCDECWNDPVPKDSNDRCWYCFRNSKPIKPSACACCDYRQRPDKTWRRPVPRGCNDEIRSSELTMEVPYEQNTLFLVHSDNPDVALTSFPVVVSEEVPEYKLVTSLDKHQSDASDYPTAFHFDCGENTAHDETTDAVLYHGHEIFRVVKGQLLSQPSPGLLRSCDEGTGRCRKQFKCYAYGSLPESKTLVMTSFRITVWDNTCWAKGDAKHYQEAFSPVVASPMNEDQCRLRCRETGSCAAFGFAADRCLFLRRNKPGTRPQVRLPTETQVFLKVRNCSLLSRCIHLNVPGAAYLSGQYCPKSVRDRGFPLYQLEGPSREASFYVQKVQKDREVEAAAACPDAKWLLRRFSSEDIVQEPTKEAVGLVELRGKVLLCIDTDLIDVVSRGDTEVSLSVATDASENVKVDLKDGEGSLNSTVDIKVQTCRNPLYERAELLNEHNIKDELADPLQAEQVFRFDDMSTKMKDDYVLGPCDCPQEVFDEVFQDVTLPPGSNNRFTPPPQLLAEGGITCSAEDLGHVEFVEEDKCQVVALNKKMPFYWFGDYNGQRICRLYTKCTRLDIEGSANGFLYGLTFDQKHCAIADPKKCWEEEKRRQFLTGYTSRTSGPECAFQDVLRACELMRLADLAKIQQCGQCQYAHAHFVSPRQPLPEMFEPGTELSLSCHPERYRGMHREDSELWDDAVLTCVDGHWMDLDAKHSLMNFVCEPGVQVTSSKKASLVKNQQAGSESSWWQRHYGYVIHNFVKRTTNNATIRECLKPIFSDGKRPLHKTLEFPPLQVHADLTKQLSPATERRHWPERFPGEDATEAQQCAPGLLKDKTCTPQCSEQVPAKDIIFKQSSEKGATSTAQCDDGYHLVSGGCSAQGKVSRPKNNSWVCESEEQTQAFAFCAPFAAVVVEAKGAAECPEGELLVGGGCAGSEAVKVSQREGPRRWQCVADSEVTAFAMCIDLDFGVEVQVHEAYNRNRSSMLVACGSDRLIGAGCHTAGSLTKSEPFRGDGWSCEATESVDAWAACVDKDTAGLLSCGEATVPALSGEIGSYCDLHEDCKQGFTCLANRCYEPCFTTTRGTYFFYVPRKRKYLCDYGDQQPILDWTRNQNRQMDPYLIKVGFFGSEGVKIPELYWDNSEDDVKHQLIWLTNMDGQKECPMHADFINFINAKAVAEKPSYVKPWFVACRGKFYHQGDITMPLCGQVDCPNGTRFMGRIPQQAAKACDGFTLCEGQLKDFGEEATLIRIGWDAPCEGSFMGFWQGPEGPDRFEASLCKVPLVDAASLQFRTPGCPAGQVYRAAATDASPSCVACPGGTYRASGQEDCRACLPGFHSPPGSPRCFPCPPHAACEADARGWNVTLSLEEETMKKMRNLSKAQVILTFGVDDEGGGCLVNGNELKELRKLSGSSEAAWGMDINFTDPAVTTLTLHAKSVKHSCWPKTLEVAELPEVNWLKCDEDKQKDQWRIISTPSMQWQARLEFIGESQGGYCLISTEGVLKPCGRDGSESFPLEMLQQDVATSALSNAPKFQDSECQQVAFKEEGSSTKQKEFKEEVYWSGVCAACPAGWWQWKHCTRGGAIVKSKPCGTWNLWCEGQCKIVPPVKENVWYSFLANKLEATGCSKQVMTRFSMQTANVKKWSSIPMPPGNGKLEDMCVDETTTCGEPREEAAISLRQAPAHKVTCPANMALRSFRFEHCGKLLGEVRFKAQCCVVIGLGSCDIVETPWIQVKFKDTDGADFFNKAEVSCEDGSVLTSLAIETEGEADAGSARYVYSCCRIPASKPVSIETLRPFVDGTLESYEGIYFPSGKVEGRMQMESYHLYKAAGQPKWKLVFDKFLGEWCMNGPEESFCARSTATHPLQLNFGIIDITKLAAPAAEASEEKVASNKKSLGPAQAEEGQVFHVRAAEITKFDLGSQRAWFPVVPKYKPYCAFRAPDGDDYESESQMDEEQASGWGVDRRQKIREINSEENQKLLSGTKEGWHPCNKYFNSPAGLDRAPFEEEYGWQRHLEVAYSAATYSEDDGDGGDGGGDGGDGGGDGGDGEGDGKWIFDKAMEAEELHRDREELKTISRPDDQDEKGFTVQSIVACAKRAKKRNLALKRKTFKFRASNLGLDLTEKLAPALCNWIPNVEVVAAPLGIGTGLTLPLSDICSSSQGVVLEKTRGFLQANMDAYEDWKEENDMADRVVCGRGEQFSLYKAFCDLHCIEDAVLKGNMAVLKSMKGLERHLLEVTQNMLHHYITQVTDDFAEKFNQLGQYQQQASLSELGATQYRDGLSKSLLETALTEADPEQALHRHLDSLRGKLDEAAAWLHSDGTAKSDGQSSVLQLAVNSTQEARLQRAVAATVESLARLAAELHGQRHSAHDLGLKEDQAVDMLRSTGRLLAHHVQTLKAAPSASAAAAAAEKAARTLQQAHGRLKGQLRETAAQSMQRRAGSLLEPAGELLMSHMATVSEAGASLAFFREEQRLIMSRVSSLQDLSDEVEMLAAAELLVKFDAELASSHHSFSQFVAAGREYVKGKYEVIRMIQEAVQATKHCRSSFSLKTIAKKIARADKAHLSMKTAEGGLLLHFLRVASLDVNASVDGIRAGTVSEALLVLEPALASALGVGFAAFLRQVKRAFLMSSILLNALHDNFLDAPDEDMHSLVSSWGMVQQAAQQLLDGLQGGPLRQQLLLSALMRHLSAASSSVAETFPAPVACRHNGEALWKLDGNVATLMSDAGAFQCDLATGHRHPIPKELLLQKPKPGLYRLSLEL
ncbi:unnamed protein product [Effrenium voratum]|nr:unnamed protein product [Effrenium voratum]